jgi:hypothetical protein
MFEKAASVTGMLSLLIAMTVGGPRVIAQPVGSRVALARLSRHRRSNRARAYPPVRRDHSATDRNSADRLVHRRAERQYTAPCR